MKTVSNHQSEVSSHSQNLSPPALSVGWDQLTELFEYTKISVEGVAPRHLTQFPDLNIRLRGALGRSLKGYGTLVKGRYDPYQRPSPYDLLFGDSGNIDPRTPIPKPVAIRGNLMGRKFLCEIYLLGQAQIATLAVLEAIIHVLEDGISLSADSTMRVGLELTDWSFERISALEPVSNCSDAVLLFDSPLIIRSGNAQSLTANAFVFSTVQRVRGLCRWLDLELPNINPTPLLNLDMSEMILNRWTRHSIRQRGRTISMQGLSGKLQICGNISPLIPALQVAALFGTGSHANLGLGAFRLALYG